MLDAIEPFSDAIRTAGLVPPDQIQADGELHRFPTNGNASDDSGWYVLHTNGIPSGAFGCWRQGINEAWSARQPTDMTPQEREQHQHELTKTKRQREVDCHRRHAEARERAT